MKKKWMYLVLAFMLFGCSKSVEMPKLQARTLTYEYGQEVFFRFDDLLDVTKFSNEELDELEKNGEIDTSSLEYDEDGNIKVGKYKIIVSYYSDVVESILIINGEEAELFEYTQLDAPIEIEQGDTEFDFSTVLTATSTTGLEVTIEYDTSEINFDEAGQYPVFLSVKDSEGHEAIYSYLVEIMEVEEEEEEKEEETPDSTEEEKEETTTNSNTQTNTTPSTNTNTNTNNQGTTNPTPANNQGSNTQGNTTPSTNNNQGSSGQGNGTSGNNGQTQTNPSQPSSNTTNSNTGDNGQGNTSGTQTPPAQEDPTPTQPDQPADPVEDPTPTPETPDTPPSVVGGEDEIPPYLVNPDQE